MPQIAQLAETFASQIFWLLVIFGFIYFVIGRGMVPKVMETVGLRDKQIADDLAAAQKARDDADAAEETWRKRENANRERAQAVVAEAKSKAQAATEARVAEAQTGIDARLDEAEHRIAAARAEAAAEIEAVAAEAAQDIASRLADVSVSEAAARSAVQETMTHG
ncbi:F0F1 ATP synthase subunit B family protein [Aurantiacibacter spongiae]|uniref:ATP synthase subunit b n=1 Tax=Aurantiacibacter spongiae TaxID=2488860 RepID=A0A3N5CTC3_9SPHN|nr:ATPase [Aurantiacibacter spongiae]RPF70620.1 ATPase [Aurantiacibacter spongiae]